MATAPHQRQLERGELADAETALLDALAREPERPELHLDAVRLYHALAEPERAATHLGRARELTAARSSPDRAAERALTLAEALDHIAHRSPEKAREGLRIVLGDDDGDDGDDSDEMAEALSAAAEVELELGSPFKARRLAERAIAAAPERTHPFAAGRAHLALARVIAARGATERAEAEGRQALDLAERHDLATLAIDALSFLAREAEQAGPGDGGDARAAALRARCRDEMERVADRLGPQRRQQYLARGQSEQMATPAGDRATTDAGQLVTTLAEMSSLISSMNDHAALLERVMDIALEIVGAERGLVILVDPEGDDMRVEVARNLDGKSIVDEREFSRNVIRAAARGQEVVTVDTAQDEWLSQQRSVSLYSIRSLVCFPLRLGERIIGAVYLDNQKRARVYRTEDLDFLRAFTHLAALAIEKSRLLAELREENVYLKRVATERFGQTNIIGSGPAMERVFRLVEKAMNSGFPVLITGETGTGKEVITKAIHFGSDRKDKPFIAQNCAAIPPELLESEMFGYRRGAFTGANQDRKGLFEAAHGGTLFLDEIGELAPGLQAKLLRVLQDGSIRRVGETFERKVDVRIISATNQDLNQAVEAGRFRLDLFYRLNVVQLALPPLRERPEDIPLLAQHFLDKTSKQMERDFSGFTSRAIERMRAYRWPGNVRELENVVARAVVFAEGTVIDVSALPPFLAEVAPRTAPPRRDDEGSPEAAALWQTVQAGGDFWEDVKKPFLKRDLARPLVREVIRLALTSSGGKYTNALRAMNMHESDYRRFMNFLAKFDLKPPRT